jgi:hypothetical protein
MLRTKAGLTLEKLLSGMENRWALCWNAREESNGLFDSPFDCACCITWAGGTEDKFLTDSCGCTCHRRIEEMAQTYGMKMFLLALASSDIMPFIPKNEKDWIKHFKKHYKWHKKEALEESKECDICIRFRRIERREGKKII